MSKAKIYRNREEAFWFFVKKLGDDDCWEWQGSRLKKRNYGRIKLKGKTIKAHRLSYELHFGEIPDGLLVRHKCDNPPCVNPRHLLLGTDIDNVADRVKRDRTAKGDKHWTRLYPNEVIKGENHHSAKLTESDVIRIRQLCSDGSNRNKLAAEFGVNWSTINRIVKGEIWTHI